MEQLEDWTRLLAELPGMVRFALIFGGCVSVIIIGCLIGLIIQVGRLVSVVQEAVPKTNAPSMAAPGTVHYGPGHPQAPNNPYYRS